MNTSNKSTKSKEKTNCNNKCLPYFFYIITMLEFLKLNVIDIVEKQ